MRERRGEKKEMSGRGWVEVPGSARSTVRAYARFLPDQIHEEDGMDQMDEPREIESIPIPWPKIEYV